MSKYEFKPEALTQTLINRVYRSGITMMDKVNKSENKGESISPDLIEDLEADYLLSCIELENSITSQLANKQKDSWKTFITVYNDLKDEEKPLYRGVIGNIKKNAFNLLNGLPKPFTPTVELPPYIYNPIIPTCPDDNFWKDIFSEAEKMEATGRDIVGNLADGAACIGGAIAAVAGGAATVATGTVVAAGAAAFAGGYHVGQAINEYMGWDK